MFFTGVPDGYPAYNTITDNLIDGATEGMKMGETHGNTFERNVREFGRVQAACSALFCLLLAQSSFHPALISPLFVFPLFGLSLVGASVLAHAFYLYSSVGLFCGSRGNS